MSDQLYWISAKEYEEHTYGVASSGGLAWGDTFLVRGLSTVNETFARVLRERGSGVQFEVRPLGPPLKLYTHDGEVPQPPKPVRIVSADPVDFGKRVAALPPLSSGG